MRDWRPGCLGEAVLVWIGGLWRLGSGIAAFRLVGEAFEHAPGRQQHVVRQQVCRGLVRKEPGALLRLPAAEFRHAHAFGRELGPGEREHAVHALVEADHR